MTDDRTPPSSPPLLDYRPLDRHPRPTARRVLSYSACFAAILGGVVLIAASNGYASLVLTGFALIVAGGFRLYALRPPPLYVLPLHYRLLSVASAASAIVGSAALIISLLFTTRTAQFESWPIGPFAWSLLSLAAFAVARLLTVRWIRSHDPTDWNPRALRRRQLRIWSLAALTFLAICCVPEVVACYGRLALQRKFRDAMTHALPPDRVVLTEDPAEAKRLQQKDPIHYCNLSGTVRITRAGYRSFLLDSVDDGLDPELFFHARQPPGRSPVLVLLTLRTTARPDGTLFTEFHATAHRPPGWLQSEWPAPYAAARLPIRLTNSDRLRILAGQPDPADPARFAVPFQLNGQPHTLVGTLDAAGQLRLTWPEPTTSPVPHGGQPP